QDWVQPGPRAVEYDASPLPLNVKRLEVHLTSDDRRVIARPFNMGSARVRSLFSRVDQLPEDCIDDLLRSVERSYADRHAKLAFVFHENFEQSAAMIGFTQHWSPQRRLLAGAYLTMEYSIDSAALFNPSIVLHPNQSGVAKGAIRFVMSLRATGEGHVSSIVFRTGVITADQRVEMDAVPDKLHRTRIAPDRSYNKALIRRKLAEMNVYTGDGVGRVLDSVPERFTLVDLNRAIDVTRASNAVDARGQEALRTLLWLAQSNFHVDLAQDSSLSEFVLFPMSEEQSNGLEDLRLTRFTDDDGSVIYHGTYTAYNGVRTLPMLLHTSDFKRIEFASLNGAAAANKGMALFPRKINGEYVMCSRIDGENLFISKSQSVHFWETAEKLIAPRYPWELMQIGNCGAPIETSRGWILLTHGVGPMRTYAIGAMLLDLNDPQKILGHLREPIITPSEEDREGYVPNVVYTCGALAHGGQLYVPFAMADKSTSFVAVDVEELVDKLVDSPLT
ncbi:MAG TPA: glycoside hydrolase family 130 protein, partial [Tepidisphaeraceae bacterium]